MKNKEVSKNLRLLADRIRALANDYGKIRQEKLDSRHVLNFLKFYGAYVCETR